MRTSESKKPNTSSAPNIENFNHEGNLVGDGSKSVVTIGSNNSSIQDLEAAAKESTANFLNVKSSIPTDQNAPQEQKKDTFKDKVAKFRQQRKEEGKKCITM